MPTGNAPDDNVASAISVIPTVTGGGVVESSDRRRGPRGMWKIVMPQMINEYHTEDFSVSDLERIGAAATGSPINSNTARSQIANYLKGGLIERVGTGRYRFTRSGLDVFSVLFYTPDAKTHPDTETPAVDDVQAAGVSPADVQSVSPKASSVEGATGEGNPR